VNSVKVYPYGSRYCSWLRDDSRVGEGPFGTAWNYVAWWSPHRDVSIGMLDSIMIEVLCS